MIEQKKSGLHTIKSKKNIPLSLFLLFSLHQSDSDVGTSQMKNVEVGHKTFVSVSDTTQPYLDSTKAHLLSGLTGLDQHSVNVMQLFEVFEQLGINHPLVANIFARDIHGKSRVDDLNDNYQKIHEIIDTHGPQVRLNPYSDRNYVGGRALLESGLRSGVVANPRSKTYNAVGLFQYIPDTWKAEYSSLLKKHPGIGIKNDRKDPKSNVLVANYHYNKSLQVCHNKPGFALWGHHAGIERIVGCNHDNAHKNPGYLNIFTKITGEKAHSMVDRYSSILPRELVDMFMSLRDNSFIYSAQVIGAQGVYDILKNNPQLIEHQINLFTQMQLTKTKGAAIDDINYPYDYSNLNNIIICDPDPVLHQLLITISDIVDQPLQIVDPHIVRKDRYTEKLAVNAIISGRGAKIKVPFSSIEILRTSQTKLGLQYKRVRYLLEMARIQGLCSLATERLPSGELVYHVGLMPHVTMSDIYRFAVLKNYNKKPLQSEELIQSQ